MELSIRRDKLSGREIAKKIEQIKILAALYSNPEMRFSELKKNTNLNDPTLSRRLRDLLSYKLITSNLHRGEKGEKLHYVTYKLTELGKETVNSLKIPDFLKGLESLNQVLGDQ